MVYTRKNYRSKAELKRALASGEPIHVYQPGGVFPDPDPNAHGVTIEGPHSPEPHRWYATADLEDGKVVKVR